MRIGEIIKNNQENVYYKLCKKKKHKRKKKKLDFNDYENLMKQGNVYKRYRGALKQIK